MTSVPQPAPQTYAAAIERAERAEQLAADRLDALAAVREAIGIPHAATVGDENIRTPILLHRIRHALICLERLIGDEPGRHDVAWTVAYFRERLGEHPAEGYRTWDEAVAELRGQEGGQP